MKEALKNIKIKRCPDCPGNCDNDKAVNWTYREINTAISHNLVPVTLGIVAHNSGLEGNIRTTKDNGSEENITHQVEINKPCKSKIIVHALRFNKIPGDLA